MTVALLGTRGGLCTFEKHGVWGRIIRGGVHGFIAQWVA